MGAPEKTFRLSIPAVVAMLLLQGLLANSHSHTGGLLELPEFVSGTPVSVASGPASARRAGGWQAGRDLRGQLCLECLAAHHPGVVPLPGPAPALTAAIGPVVGCPVPPAGPGAVAPGARAPPATV